ncbi:hypothetical protein BH23PLA1_BH23PLA1_18530 [soil metagenome]
MQTIEATGEFVAFDLETTGLFPETDRVVEIGAVRFDRTGLEFGRYNRLVNPGRPMSPSAEAIHGLSDLDLAGEPGAPVVLPDFLTWLGDPRKTTLLAHHARFDAGFLGRELARLGLPFPDFEVIDTLHLARCRRPEFPNHQLETLARGLQIDHGGPQHRALADSLRVKALWLALEGDRGPHLSYPIFDPAREQEAPPNGWDRLAEAIRRNRPIRMEYAGGSRGTAPRDITPRRFLHKGGVAYIVGFCHLEGFEKAFRLDRLLCYDVLDPVSTGPFLADRRRSLEESRTGG